MEPKKVGPQPSEQNTEKVNANKKIKVTLQVGLQPGPKTKDQKDLPPAVATPAVATPAVARWEAATPFAPAVATSWAVAPFAPAVATSWATNPFAQPTAIPIEGEGVLAEKRMTTFGKTGVRSTERKIWRHDKRVGGRDYADAKQRERVGAEKALQLQVFHLQHKYLAKVKQVPHPQYIFSSLGGSGSSSASSATPSTAPKKVPED